eukprot:5507237-Pyramimonas_sp.AAC.1
MTVFRVGCAAAAKSRACRAAFSSAAAFARASQQREPAPAEPPCAHPTPPDWRRLWRSHPRLRAP